MKYKLDERIKWSLKVIGIGFTSWFNAMITVVWGLVGIYALFKLTGDLSLQQPLLTENIYNWIKFISNNFEEWVIMFTGVNFYCKWKENQARDKK
jgi:hypothetical protein